MDISSPSTGSNQISIGGENALNLLERRVSETLKNDNAGPDADTLRKGVIELAQSAQKTVPGMSHSYTC